MDPIFESYSQDVNFTKFLEAAGDKLTQFQKDFTDLIVQMKKGRVDYAPSLDKMRLHGSSSWKNADLKKLKDRIKKEINPDLQKYFIETLAAYIKSGGEPFSGYETIMIALGAEKNKIIFKQSDFNIKDWEDTAADRLAASLMYGGDRLNAYAKYGNVPVRQWAKIIKNNMSFLRDTDMTSWMATEVGGDKLEKSYADGEISSDDLFELFRKKYKI